MKKLFLFTAVSIMLVGCTKNPTTQQKQMVLEAAPNAIFKLYNNRNDWASEVNPIINKQVGPDGKIVLENLINDSLYYYDVYIPDSSYSNWYSNGYADENKLQLRYIERMHTSVDHEDAGIRKLLLGTAKQTKWKLIDVRNFEGTNSFWSTMTDCEKDKELVFQKDFISTLKERANASGCSNPATSSYDFYAFYTGNQIYLRPQGSNIPNGSFSHLIDVIEETVGTTKIKRLKVYELFNEQWKIAIFTKE